MIKTTAMILKELNRYASPADKLSRMVQKEEYIPVIKGIYETNRFTAGYLLAGSIYGPSYLSFEFALSYYGLIPEAVYTFTSATFEKKKKKKYITPFGTFTYRDIPSQVYPYGLEIKVEGEYSYIIASPEKALCDQLYQTKPVSNQKELINLLFRDLRISEEELRKLNSEDIEVFAGKYGNTNIKRLSNFMRRL